MFWETAQWQSSPSGKLLEAFQWKQELICSSNCVHSLPCSVRRASICISTAREIATATGSRVPVDTPTANGERITPIYKTCLNLLYYWKEIVLKLIYISLLVIVFSIRCKQTPGTLHTKFLKNNCSNTMIIRKQIKLDRETEVELHSLLAKKPSLVRESNLGRTWCRLLTLVTFVTLRNCLFLA